MSADDETPETERPPNLDTSSHGSPPDDDDDLEFVDAMILGDASINPDEFDMMEGTNVNERGQTNSYLLYTTGSTSRGLTQESIPSCRDLKANQETRLTPYERFVLELIDGHKNVSQIQETAGLDRQEVMTTLLTLLDKQLIDFPSHPEEESSPPSGRVRIDRQNSVLDEEPLGVLIPDQDTLATPAPQSIRARTGSPSDNTPLALLDQDTVEIDGELARALTARRKLITKESASSRHDPSVNGQEEEPETHHGQQIRDDLDETQVNEIAQNKDWDDAPLEPAIPPLLDIKPQPIAAPNIPAAVTELSAEYLQVLPSSSEQNKDFDFGEDKAELSLSLGLPEESEAYSDLELNRPFSELDLEAEEKEQNTSPNKVKDASSDLLNEAVAFAMNELADELSLEEGQALPELGMTDEDDDLELSDAFLSLEKKLKKPKPPVRKPSIKLEPVDQIEAPMRLASQFIKALPEEAPKSPPKSPTPQSAQPPNKRQLNFTRPRGVIKELDRRKNAPISKRSTEPKKSLAHKPSAKNSRGGGTGPSGAGLARADKLFQEALADKANGNVVSARMNIKLALTFDPDNPLYIETLEKLQQEVPSKVKRPSQAMEYYEQATMAERNGKVDEAIEYLYKALGFAKDPPIYNRLGVLLAMKKMEFTEARKMIETAISKDPTNATYQHNLQKVLAMQASLDVDSRNAKPKPKKGLLGFLSRKKKG